MTHVQVLEAAPAIEPVGVDMNLPPNATRELIELGLVEGFVHLGVETSYISYYDPSGSLRRVTLRPEPWNDCVGRSRFPACRRASSRSI